MLCSGRSTVESTSIERQREIIQQWCDANSHAVVGWASDVDVSGSVDPFETPDLGKWLGQRASEFDIVACWKLDRLGRNAIQLNKLFGWCKEHDKTVVSLLRVHRPQQLGGPNAGERNRRPS